MNRLIIFYCIALILASLSQIAGANIFVSDDRETIPASKMISPLNNVIFLSNGCTGSLVGHRLILTAAHCLVSDKNAITIPGLYYKRDGGHYTKRLSFEKVWVGHFLRFKDSKDDWALILVKEKTPHFFGIQSIKAPLNKVNLAGFSEDLSDQLGLSANCRITSVEKNVILHDCDTTRGASGSPIYTCDKNGGCSIVALHRGGPRETEHSLFLMEYSDEFANRAVPVEQFMTLLGQLKKQYP